MRGRGACRGVVRYEQAAAEAAAAPAAAEAAVSARAALGHRVLDRQILDRRPARVDEQPAVGLRAVEKSALAVEGERVGAGEVDRGNVGAFRQGRAGFQRDAVMRAVAAVRLRGEIDRLDVGAEIGGGGNVEIACCHSMTLPGFAKRSLEPARDMTLRFRSLNYRTDDGGSTPSTAA